MTLSSLIGIAAATFCALLTTVLVYPQVLKFAKKRSLLDNPNERKLQRNPVPVMGGIPVFFGLIAGLCVASFFIDVTELFPMFVAIFVMLCVGVADDIAGLSPKFRFIVEIAMTLMFMFWSSTSLNDFQGLWGFGEMPIWLSIPASIVAVVGIINAINLIDGVDGLSSGYCILASLAFSLLFYRTGSIAMFLLCCLAAVSLIPFFFHNVFGKTSKMFIGDGGSLMMGVVMSSYVVTSISSGGNCELFALSRGMGLVPFTLAVMCVPVFDTVRVMVMRILRHTSPFLPDKTHMHHLFIELGFSHVGTTFSVLMLNVLVVISWLISYKMGASIDIQFYVVMGVGLALTAGFYKLMRICINRNNSIYRMMTKIGALSHVENSKVWLALQKIADLK